MTSSSLVRHAPSAHRLSFTVASHSGDALRVCARVYAHALYECVRLSVPWALTTGERRMQTDRWRERERVSDRKR